MTDSWTNRVTDWLLVWTWNKKLQTIFPIWLKKLIIMKGWQYFWEFPEGNHARIGDVSFGWTVCIRRLFIQSQTDWPFLERKGLPTQWSSRFLSRCLTIFQLRCLSWKWTRMGKMTTISNRHLTDMRCKAYFVRMWDNGRKNSRVRSEIKIDIAAASVRVI